MTGKTKVKCTAGEHKGKVGYIDGYVASNVRTYAVIVIGGEFVHANVFGEGITDFDLITEEEAPKEEWPKCELVTDLVIPMNEKVILHFDGERFEFKRGKAQEAFDKMKEVARSLSGK